MFLSFFFFYYFPLNSISICCNIADSYAAAAKSLQSCQTLCDPIDSSPPGSPIPGIHQARTLEWIAISFSNAWKWKVKMKSLSLVRLLATTRTAAYQATPSMGFSRQEYWSGVSLPSPADSYRHRQKNNFRKWYTLCLQRTHGLVRQTDTVW